tara:strand:+ start:4239 stop:4586 length:348 start_codon:yes stop_codon:yes gene_type:complete
MNGVNQSLREYKAGDKVMYWIRDAKTPESQWTQPTNQRHPKLIQKAGEWREGVVTEMRMCHQENGAPFPMVMVEVIRTYCSGVWNTETLNNDLTFFSKLSNEGVLHRENLRLLSK